MKTTKFNTTVDIPSTPSEWQLYTDHADAKLAAADLTDTLAHCLEHGVDLQTTSNTMYAVQKSWQDAGALDTEATSVVVRTLSRIYKKRA